MEMKEGHKQKQSISINFQKSGEFSINVEGELSPEVMDQIRELQNQASYYRQKDAENEKQSVNLQYKLDSTVLAFAGSLFVVLVYLTSNVVSFGKMALETHFQQQNQPVNVKYQK